MKDKEQISEVLLYMSSDFKKNVELLKELFCQLNVEPKDYLLVLTRDLYSEHYCFLAINSLLLYGDANPNTKSDVQKANFIQNAINSGYGGKFVLDLIRLSNDFRLKEKLNPNHTNIGDFTMLHTAIYSENYYIDVVSLYKLLIGYGFDSTRVDAYGNTVADAIISQSDFSKKYNHEIVLEFIDLYQKEVYTEDIVSVIKETVNKTSDNSEENALIIKNACSKRKVLTYNDFLYVLSQNVENEDRALKAIEALLKDGANPNYKPMDGLNSILQNFIQCGCSEEFIVKAILLMTDSKICADTLNCNIANIAGDTVLHTAIKSGKYNGDIIHLYHVLDFYGFDSDAIDGDGNNLMEVISYVHEQTGRFKSKDIDEFRKIYNSSVSDTTMIDDRDDSDFVNPKYSSGEETIRENKSNLKIDNKVNLNSFEFSELEKYGVVLTNKNFVVEPIIGREREVKNLMVSLAQDKKNPIIVGESGVGKTALVDELAYLIKNDKVPSFLKNKIIYEVNPGELVAGCKYVGEFEKKLNEMFNVALKNEAILFIDEIHTIYGVGASENKSTGMETYLKHFIDRNNIKIIGTTTEDEYQKYFASDALKRRFEKIKVEEPDEETLSKIINKVIDDYCLKSNLKFENETEKDDIVEIIVLATNKSHRVYDDRINNPDLAISIVDKAFAFAKYCDCKFIGKENFADSFDYCDRIYESARDRAIRELKNKKKIVKSGAKILEVDFSKFRR